MARLADCPCEVTDDKGMVFDDLTPVSSDSGLEEVMYGGLSSS